MIPHVTQFDEADVTGLEALRQEINQEERLRERTTAPVRVTILAFILKALVPALKEFPEFNSSLEGDNLILKKYFNLGFAADTADGLVVPVIRDVDQKGFCKSRARPRNSPPPRVGVSSSLQTCRADASPYRVSAGSAGPRSRRLSTRRKWRFSASRSYAQAGLSERKLRTTTDSAAVAFV